MGKIKAISFDITGTLIKHKHPIAFVYHNAMKLENFDNIPDINNLKASFKQAMEELTISKPCYNFNERDWWKELVHKTIRNSQNNCNYSNKQLDKLFRRIYQHYGRVDAYEVYPDALSLLNYLKENKILCGVTSNSPYRTIECVLPMIGLDSYFSFFTSCQDSKYEKPSKDIFIYTLNEVKTFIHDIEPSNILHIGDELIADYLGAKSAGCQSIFIDRNNNNIDKHLEFLRIQNLKHDTDISDFKSSLVNSLVDIIPVISISS